MEETLDQLRAQRMIEHLEIAIGELQRYQVSPIIIASMQTIHSTFMADFVDKYAKEEVPAPPTVVIKGKELSKSTP